MLQVKSAILDFAVVDVLLPFIDNCRKKFPKVVTCNRSIEEETVYPDNIFDLVYMSSVLEHCRDVEAAITNAMSLGKEFLFIMFKWSWSGDIAPHRKPEGHYSTCFNIWTIFDIIRRHGNIESAKVFDGKYWVDFEKFAKGKTGSHRGYLAIKGGVLYEND